MADGRADTGNWLGILQVEHAPWLWSHGHGRWLYIPEPDADASGAWMYLPRR